MAPSWIRRAVAALVVVVLATSLAACSGDDGGAGAARVASPDPRLSDAEWDYGQSISRDTDGVTFQPDVVIPGGGAQSVVSVSGDGLTWTLDGDAAEVGDLAVDKLLLVTNRGAGRVLAKQELPDGDVAVTIGPAEITDFIRDIETSYTGEVDPNLLQFRAAPALPSAADVTNRSGEGGDGAEGEGDSEADGSPGSEPGGTEDDGSDGGGVTTTEPNDGATPETTEPATGPQNLTGAPVARPASMAVQASPAQGGPPADPGVLPPPSRDPLPVVPVEGMKVFPLRGSDGSWGVELAYDRNGLRVRGSARVYLEKPSIGFDLVIRDGKIVTAEAKLDGVAGVRATFDAGTETGLQANIHQIVDLPLDISLPIFGPSLPFAVNFHQSFKIDTVFSAKNSTLSFNGDYAFRGSLRAGYRDGSFGVAAPSGLSVRKSLLQSTSGVSVGVNGFIIAHKLRMTIGIGGFGFAVGPYVALTTAMSVVNGSDLGIVKCKGATLNLDMGYGIGYVMPTAVVKVINVFLRALNLNEIKPTGGTPPITTHLATLQGYAPKMKICEGAV